MNVDKETENLFTNDEIPQPGNEDTLPSDENLDVEFGDPF